MPHNANPELESSHDSSPTVAAAEPRVPQRAGSDARDRKKKPRVLFVGGFGKSGDGTQGGQVFACNSLLQSPLSALVTWVLVDSTQRSEPPPGVVVRLLDALRRVGKVTAALLFWKIEVLLVFSNLQPLGIAEKGLYCMMGRLTGKRVVLAVRSQPVYPKRMKSLYRFWVRTTFRACTSVLCQTQATAEDLATNFGLDPSRTHIVPNWLDTRIFFPARAETDPRPAVTRLAYVGWLNENKGIEHLIRALPAILRKRQDFHVDLYGGGGLEPFLKDLAADLQVSHHVTFHGWIDHDQVPGVLNRADVFVFPSQKEGMPNALLQAMACGLPVIASSIPGIRPLVDHGVNGILVAPRSPEELAAAVLEMLEDPQKRLEMGKRNVTRVQQFHNGATAWIPMALVLLPHWHPAPEVDLKQGKKEA